MKSQQSRRWMAWIVVLLLITTALRTTLLESVPPGLTHDEAGNGYDAARILEGEHRIYFPTGYGREPLYQYSVAVSTWLLGRGVFSLRITTVFWSLITWICTVALARKWWGRLAAIFTGTAMTASFWALMMSRVGLRGPVLPALLSASALAYAHGLSGKTRPTGKPTDRTCLYFIASGILLGLSLYTYMASRGMPLLYLGFLFVLAFTQRRTLKRIWVSTLLVVSIAVLVSMPLILHLRAHPELESRVGQLAGGLTQAMNGDFSVLIKNITDSLPMLIWRADPQWLYNIAGRPALEPVLAILFIAGLILALTRFRERRNSFTVLWLLGGLAPAFLTSEWYNTLHAIAAMPAVFLLIGSGGAWLVQKIAKVRISAAKMRGITLLMTLIVLSATLATRDYFINWARQPDVNTLYHRHTYELAHDLNDTLPEAGTAIIGTQYPDRPHDPYIFDNVITRKDVTLRFADARHALFIPNKVVWLTLDNDQQTDLNPLLLSPLTAHLQCNRTLSWPGYQPHTVTLYRWDAPLTWNALLQSASRTVTVTPDSSTLHEIQAATTLPLAYGNSVHLNGYHVDGAPKPGEALNVLTLWTISAPIEGEWQLFTHLITEDDAIITQADRLDAPNWQWQAGDRFAQVHTLNLPADAPTGQAWLAVGIFETSTWQRLPITENTTRILIPIEITQ